MPLIKNSQRLKELNDIKNLDDESKPCYARYYDTLAKRYGYTIEQFYGLTLRQVHILLNTSNDQSYDELEVQAALMGRKLKPKMKMLDVSVEEEMDQEQDAMDALKRLRERYEGNNGR